MLFHKMLRDMKQNKTQFISIFLMAILGVFIYAGISSEWYGLHTKADEFYNQTNLADAWIYGRDISKEKVNTVANLAGVDEVERRLTVESVVELDNNPTLTLHFVDKGNVSRIKLVKGEDFSIDKDGIWVDDLFADANGVKVGDRIKLSISGIIMEKTILGTIMHPEYVYSAKDNDIMPNHNNYGYAFLSYKAFPKEMPIVYSEMLITTNGVSTSKLEKEIDRAFDGNYGVFLDRKDIKSYMQFNEEVKQHRAMGKIFPIIFLAIAMLTILTTMARMVNNQRTQIGVLKAMGFKRRRILFHYISYGLWISLIGAVIGTIIGPFSLPYLFYGPMKAVYTLPEWGPAISGTIVMMAVLSVAGCTLAAYIACRNVLKDTPAQTLRPKAPRNIKHSFIEHGRLWKKLSFNAQWNFRDVFRSKVRSLMAVVGVLGCTALLVCAFGMQDSMNDIKVWNFEQINKYDTKLMLNEDSSDEQVSTIIKQYNGEAYMEDAVEIKANNTKKTGAVLVTDHVSLIHFVNKDRKEIKLPADSVSISYKMANLLGVKAGDEISWHIYGEENWIKSKIGAVYRTPLSQGITLSREVFEATGHTFKATSIITPKAVDNKPDGVAKVWKLKDMHESYNNMTEAMNMMVYVLILAAVLLAVVVLYNLGVLSFTEQNRELSTLKVIGFKTRKIRSLLLTQNIWLSVVGIILGIPFGIWIMVMIFSYMGDNLDFAVSIKFTSYLYSTAGTLLVSIAVNRLFSKRVKNIDMVSSLKGVE